MKNKENVGEKAISLSWIKSENVGFPISALIGADNNYCIFERVSHIV